MTDARALVLSLPEDGAASIDAQLLWVLFGQPPGVSLRTAMGVAGRIRDAQRALHDFEEGHGAVKHLRAAWTAIAERRDCARWLTARAVEMGGSQADAAIARKAVISEVLPLILLRQALRLARSGADIPDALADALDDWVSVSSTSARRFVLWAERRAELANGRPPSARFVKAVTAALDLLDEAPDARERLCRAFARTVVRFIEDTDLYDVPRSECLVLIERIARVVGHPHAAPSSLAVFEALSLMHLVLATRWADELEDLGEAAEHVTLALFYDPLDEPADELLGRLRGIPGNYRRALEMEGHSQMAEHVSEAMKTMFDSGLGRASRFVNSSTGESLASARARALMSELIRRLKLPERTPALEAAIDALFDAMRACRKAPPPKFAYRVRQRAGTAVEPIWEAVKDALDAGPIEPEVLTRRLPIPETPAVTPPAPPAWKAARPEVPLAMGWLSWFTSTSAPLLKLGLAGGLAMCVHGGLKLRERNAASARLESAYTQLVDAVRTDDDLMVVEHGSAFVQQVDGADPRGPQAAEWLADSTARGATALAAAGDEAGARRLLALFDEAQDVQPQWLGFKETN